jgi:hypothetical protein
MAVLYETRLVGYLLYWTSQYTWRMTQEEEDTMWRQENCERFVDNC